MFSVVDTTIEIISDEQHTVIWYDETYYKVCYRSEYDTFAEFLDSADVSIIKIPFGYLGFIYDDGDSHRLLFTALEPLPEHITMSKKALVERYASEGIAVCGKVEQAYLFRGNELVNNQAAIAIKQKDYILAKIEDSDAVQDAPSDDKIDLSIRDLVLQAGFEPRSKEDKRRAFLLAASKPKKS